VLHFIYNYAECHYAECRKAECCSAECRYAECRYAECYYAEYRSASEKTNTLAYFTKWKIGYAVTPNRPTWLYRFGLYKHATLYCG
jgi:hypothetical protein